MKIKNSYHQLNLGDPVYETGWVILNPDNSVWTCQLFQTAESAHNFIKANWSSYPDKWSNLTVVMGKATFEPIVNETLSTIVVAGEIVEDPVEAQS